jgi:hypothetical protein
MDVEHGYTLGTQWLSLSQIVTIGIEKHAWKTGKEACLILFWSPQRVLVALVGTVQ